VSGKKERQRKLARERMLRQQARRAERARKARQITIVAVICCVVAGLGVGGYFLFAGPGSSKAAAVSATSSATPSASASTQAEPATTCSYQASGTAARNVGTPPAKPDYKAVYQATIHTNRGDVVINLLNSKATCTVGSFVYLAAKKYFNGTHCHRLTTIDPFVLQCGDPTGTGSGGPGYAIPDEFPKNLKIAPTSTPPPSGQPAPSIYPAGSVAMANSSQPNSGGSQFFLVYKDSQLPPNYTVFGTVTPAGMTVLQKIAAAGITPGTDPSSGSATPNDGKPKTAVTITTATAA
jgi:peptidyl-prolyl cis-trans isomerase B (cyclophilin B)